MLVPREPRKQHEFAVKPGLLKAAIRHLGAAKMVPGFFNFDAPRRLALTPPSVPLVSQTPSRMTGWLVWKFPMACRESRRHRAAEYLVAKSPADC